MAAGINIGVGSDTRVFAKGVQDGLIEPLEDAQDVLKDLATTGDKTTADLEGQFRDQQHATEQYGRDYQRMSEQVQQASRQTKQKVTTDSKETARETSEGFDEIKDSARSNAVETAASFDGSFDSITGGLQGLLSEFLGGFGPAGIIAGLGAAALLGAVTNAITEGGEAAEAQKQQIADLASEYIATGKSGKRAFDDVASAIESMATSTDGADVAITLQDAYKAAAEAGADYQGIVQAIATSTPNEIQDAIDAVKRLQQQHVDAGNAAKEQGLLGETAADRTVAASGRLLSALEKTQRTAKDAARAQELAAKAGLSDFQLKAGLIKQVEDAYDDAAAGADHFNKKTGEFDATGYIKEFRGIRHELKKYKDDLAESNLSPEAKKFLESQGAESAAAMLRGYQKAGPQQKRELGEIWSTAGTENATNYEDALGKKIGAIKTKAPKIDTPKIPAPDTEALDRYIRQPHVVKVVIDAYTRSGQRVL